MADLKEAAPSDASLLLDEFMDFTMRHGYVVVAAWSSPSRYGEHGKSTASPLGSFYHDTMSLNSAGRVRERCAV